MKLYTLLIMGDSSPELTALNSNYPNAPTMNEVTR